MLAQLVPYERNRFPATAMPPAHPPVIYYADVRHRQWTSACVRCYAAAQMSWHMVYVEHGSLRYYVGTWQTDF